MDTRFNYTVVSDDEFKEFTESFVYFDENGVEVPYPNRRRNAEVAKTPQRGRRSRALASSADSGNSPAPAMIHHSSVLMKTMNQGRETSSEPSTPREDSRMENADNDADATEVALSLERQTVTDWVPKLPSGASDPDAFGVRTVTKKTSTSHRWHNNRLILPPLFEFEPHEIGFRDSYNASAHGANEKNRGPYLDKPNSPYFHLDPTQGRYDCTKYVEGDLDEALIKKHALHPKFGIFLKSSRNDPEPPKPLVSGLNPKVLLTRDGRRHQLSRSVAAIHVETDLKQEEIRSKLGRMTSKFCEIDRIDKEEVFVSEATLEALRRGLTDEHQADEDSKGNTENVDGSLVRPEALDSRLGPIPFPPMYLEHRGNSSEGDSQGGSPTGPPTGSPTGLPTGSPTGKDPETADSDQDENKPVKIDLTLTLLEAAAQLSQTEREQRVVEQKEESSKRQLVSRPYDAVRDIFAGSDDPRCSPPQPDTSKLICLADLAEQSQGTQYQGLGAQDQRNQQQTSQYPPCDPDMFKGHSDHETKKNFLKDILNTCPEESVPGVRCWHQEESQQPRHDLQASGSRYNPADAPQPTMVQETAPSYMYESCGRYPDERDVVSPPYRDHRNHSIDSSQGHYGPPEAHYPPLRRETSGYYTPPAPPTLHPYQNGSAGPESHQASYQASPYGSYYPPLQQHQHHNFGSGVPPVQPSSRDYEPGYGQEDPQYQPQYQYQPSSSRYPGPRQPSPPTGHYGLPHQAQPSHHAYSYSTPPAPTGKDSEGLLDPYGGIPSAHYQGMASDRGLLRPEQLSPKSISRGRGRPRLSNMPVASAMTMPRSLSQMPPPETDMDSTIDPKFKRLQPKAQGLEMYPHTIIDGPRPKNGKGELRTIHYNHAESIKDYHALEPPPASGPLNIRGWSINKVKRSGSSGSSPTEG